MVQFTELQNWYHIQGKGDKSALIMCLPAHQSFATPPVA